MGAGWTTVDIPGQSWRVAVVTGATGGIGFAAARELACAGATVVPTDDPRSAAQRAQTDAATRRDARSAQVLESERLKQEGKPAQAVIPETAPQAVAPPTDRTLTKARPKKPELFTAVAPRKPGDAAPKKKKKAEKKTAKKKPAKTPEA